VPALKRELSKLFNFPLLTYLLWMVCDTMTVGGRRLYNDAEDMIVMMICGSVVKQERWRAKDCEL
jgi:hypothetical protein